MAHSVIDRITRGPYWLAKSFTVVVLAAALFSCAPAVVFYRGYELPPAYQLKAEQPFADTALLQVPDDPGERSHGAKLTPRLFGSLLLSAATRLSLHPYVPATLGGLLYLMSGIVVGHRLTQDRVTVLCIGLLFAGFYVTNACFSMNFAPKPFDGIALGMVAVTMMLVDRPWLSAASAYVACWTDERAMLSTLLILVALLVVDDLACSQRRRRCGALLAAVCVYLVTRSIVADALDWSSADTSMLGDRLLGAMSFSQLAAWTCFEGGWILVAMAVVVGWRRGSVLSSLLIAAAALGCILSCLVARDISRAASFAFPLIFAAVGLLAQESKRQARTSGGKKDQHPGDLDSASGMDRVHRLRLSVGFAAGISLVATNFEVIAWTVAQPLPSTPIMILCKWLKI